MYASRSKKNSPCERETYFFPLLSLPLDIDTGYGLQQCSPQFERDLLLQARKADSPWAPHLLCAFQTPTHLKLVMEYAEGGTLWDVLESSPHDGRILEADLRWWMPQVVSAIHWCHSQGFAHRCAFKAAQYRNPLLCLQRYKATQLRSHRHFSHSADRLRFGGPTASSIC